MVKRRKGETLLKIEKEEISITEYTHDGGVNKYRGSVTLEVYARLHDCSPIITDNQSIAHFLRDDKRFDACEVTLIEDQTFLSQKAEKILNELYGVTEVVVIQLGRG